MATPDDYAYQMSQFIPDFSDFWKSQDQVFAFQHESNLHWVFSDFADCVITRLRDATLPDREPLFDFIESVVAGGGVDADVACKCFLKRLLEQTQETSRGLQPDSFLPYLGPKSRGFCKAWEAFVAPRTIIVCPNAECGQKLRLPRVDGPLRVTCRRCKAVFEYPTADGSGSH